ncbi:MAG TPA: lysophospholipid acyltransferase family protein [Vicinamibacterales bacterium]|nr:lysophospholipid acyltransferase family protein [Vicinamibacterales bacterium]
MSFVRSLLTYVLVSIYILFAGIIGLGIAIPFRWKGLLYELGHAGAALALGTAGIRYRVVGRERLPPGVAVIFCSNHQSNVDPPVLFQALHRRLHILYKAELSRIPILGTAMQIGGFVPIDRDNRDAAFRAIERAADSVRTGNSFLIFPEGTRSRTGDLLPFKKGGFILAMKAQAPIVPVAVTGGRASMRKGSAIIHPVLVTVRIGQPIETCGMTMDDRDRLIALVRDRITQLLREALADPAVG